MGQKSCLRASTFFCDSPPVDLTPERSDVLPTTASQTVTQIFEVGDVDGDGVGDLGVVTGLRGTWEASTPNTAWGIFPGEAGNSFGSQPVDVGLGDFPFSQSVGDVNGDGYADSVVAVSLYCAERRGSQSSRRQRGGGVTHLFLPLVSWGSTPSRPINDAGFWLTLYSFF